MAGQWMTMGNGSIFNQTLCRVPKITSLRCCSQILINVDPTVGWLHPHFFADPYLSHKWIPENVTGNPDTLLSSQFIYCIHLYTIPLRVNTIVSCTLPFKSIDRCYPGYPHLSLVNPPFLVGYPAYVSIFPGQPIECRICWSTSNVWFVYP